MTSDEFDRWIESHANSFGKGCIEYLESADAFGSWRRILLQFDVTDATDGTTKLLGGELGEWRAFNDHPRILRGYCAECRNARANLARAAEPRFRDAVRCLRCQDTGWCDVWGSLTLEAIRAGKDEVPFYGSVMACDCDLGKSKLRDGSRQFQEGVDAPVLTWRKMSDQLPDLLAFLQRRKKPARPVYQEFAQFSGKDAAAR